MRGNFDPMGQGNWHIGIMSRLAQLVATVATMATTSFAAADPPYDAELARSAGAAYVEAYLRRVPLQLSQIDWSDPTVEFRPANGEDSDGLVAVFFRESSGPGGGFAVFEVLGVFPDRLRPRIWGATRNLAATLSCFQNSGSVRPSECSPAMSSAAEDGG